MPKSKQSPNARFLFQFRVRDDELAAFRAAAEKVNTNPSEWARTILRREAGLWTGQRRTTDMTTTNRTITDRQIATLAEEAAAAGDDAQVAICERALGCNTGINATDRERREAREECARVIAEAEAMR